MVASGVRVREVYPAGVCPTVVGGPAKNAPVESVAKEPSLIKVIMEAEATLGVIRVVSRKSAGVFPSSGA